MRKFRLLAILLIVLLFSCNQGDQQAETAAADTGKPSAETPVPPATNIDEAKLLGSWVRTDSPYELRILEFRSDGNMLAGYFNPKSINIGKANWSKSETVVIYVELQDVNYPGSNYLLRYLPEQDILTGQYFQAVEGATYDVAFARKK